MKRPTGTVTVELKAEGIRFTINEGVAWDAITLGEKEFKALLRKNGCFVLAPLPSGLKTVKLWEGYFGNKVKHFF